MWSLGGGGVCKTGSWEYEEGEQCACMIWVAERMGNECEVGERLWSGQMHLCRYMYEVMHPLQFMRPCRPFQGPTLLTVHNTIPISQREREKGCCSMLASHAEFDNNRPSV